MRVDCQWGLSGARQPADVAIIVDVLSFSTSVTVAVERGAPVFPFWGEHAEALAATIGGRAASKTRTRDAPSLSPASLANACAGEALVLSSLNGARCALAAGAEHVFCGSLRNAAAVAKIAAEAGDRILVVPAGETWPDGSMRVAFEDLAGAGAIVARLGGDLSPEALAARACFMDAKDELLPRLLACPSGIELVERAFAEDVRIASQLDVSPVAPMLMMHRARYRDLAPSPELAAKRVRYFDNPA
jgi:2-phosphosulfolactate phosphatase